MLPSRLVLFAVVVVVAFLFLVGNKNKNDYFSRSYHRRPL